MWGSVTRMLGWLWSEGPGTGDTKHVTGDGLIDDLCVKIQAEETEMALEMIHMIHDVNKLSTDFGLSPLHVAAETGNIRCVHLLLLKSADVNIRDCRLYTPLHLTAGSAGAGQECIQSLLDAGADINARDIWGRTPLHRATIYKQRTVTDLLLDAGCDVNIQDNDDRSVLMYLSHYPYWSEDMLDKILRNGRANVNLVDRRGQSALYYAVLSRQIHVIKVLMNNGVDLSDQRPIKYAIAKCDMECVLTMIQHGVKISETLTEVVFSRQNIRFLKMLLCAHGHRLMVASVQRIILSQLNKQGWIPGLQNLPVIDISWIVRPICLLLSTNSIPLRTLEPPLAMYDGYQLLNKVKADLGYEDIPPLTYFCRTVIRNQLAENRVSLLLGIKELTSLPPLLQDFILVKEYLHD